MGSLRAPSMSPRLSVRNLLEILLRFKGLYWLDSCRYHRYRITGIRLSVLDYLPRLQFTCSAYIEPLLPPSRSHKTLNLGQSWTKVWTITLKADNVLEVPPSTVSCLPFNLPHPRTLLSYTDICPDNCS